MILHCRLDPELRRAIDEHAAENDMTVSEAARDLLRIAVGMDAPTRGYAEGKLEGIGEIKRRLQGS